MTTFFYRPWAGCDPTKEYSQCPQPTNEGVIFNQFYNNGHRWGYAALLILTLIAGVILNSVFLSAYLYNWSNFKKLPHLFCFVLSIRDFIVALVMIPICIDWFIVNMGGFNAGQFMCYFTSFLDHTLAAAYPLLLIVFGVILYTRKFPKTSDEIEDQFSMDEMQPPPSSMNYRNGSRPPSVTVARPAHGSRPPSVQGSRQGSRPPSVQGQKPPSFFKGSRTPSEQGSRAASVAGSVGGFQPKRPTLLNQTLKNQHGNNTTPNNRPGSVTGSIEGRLAGSGGRRREREFMASSPLHEATEEEMDLWDAASLDYPGRMSPGEGNGWEFMDDQNVDMFTFEGDEPRFHLWHYIVLGLTCALALGLGVPAAMVTKHPASEIQTYHPGDFPQRQSPRDNNQQFRPRQPPPSNLNPFGFPERPGCFINVDILELVLLNDQGFYFILSNLIITYLFPILAILVLISMLCCKENSIRYEDKTLSEQYPGYTVKKLTKHFKILMACFVTFLISRSPLDISQLKSLFEAAYGIRKLSKEVSELELEIMSIWCAYIPLVIHPIIYFCFGSEYRNQAKKLLRILCGCQDSYEKKQQDKMDKYKSDEILSERSAVSKTQVSNML